MVGATGQEHRPDAADLLRPGFRRRPPPGHAHRDAGRGPGLGRSRRPRRQPAPVARAGHGRAAGPRFLGHRELRTHGLGPAGGAGPVRRRPAGGRDPAGGHLSGRCHPPRRGTGSRRDQAAGRRRDHPDPRSRRAGSRRDQAAGRRPGRRDPRGRRAGDRGTTGNRPGHVGRTHQGGHVRHGKPHQPGSACRVPAPAGWPADPHHPSPGTVRAGRHAVGRAGRKAVSKARGQADRQARRQARCQAGHEAGRQTWHRWQARHQRQRAGRSAPCTRWWPPSSPFSWSASWPAPRR